MGLAEAETPQVRRVCFLQRGVDLIRGEDDRLLLRPKHLDDTFIGGCHADGCVEHEDDGVGQVNRNLCLLSNGTVQALDVNFPATRINEREVAARPLGRVGDAISSHAGRILHNGLAPPQNTVDERGLSDVRATDDSENGQTRGNIACFRERGFAGQKRQVFLVEVELVEVGAHDASARLRLFVAHFEGEGRGRGLVGAVVVESVGLEFGGRVRLIVKVIHPLSLRRGAPQRPNGSPRGAPVHR